MLRQRFRETPPPPPLPRTGKRRTSVRLWRPGPTPMQAPERPLRTADGETLGGRGSEH